MMNLAQIGSMSGFPNRSSLVLPSAYSPQLWADMESSDQFTPISFGLGRVISSVNNRGVNGKTINFYATDRWPRWNGEGTYFNGQYGLKSGAAGDYNFMHNGSSFTLFFSLKVLTVAESSTTYVLSRTNSGSNSSIGYNLIFVNDAGLNRRNAIQFTVTNGSSAIINIVTSQQAIVQNAYNYVMITYNGTTCTIYSNGSQVGTATRSLSSSASNHTNIMTIGCNQSGTGGAPVYAKHFILYNSLLSGTEQTNVNNYLIARNLNTITPTPVNVYLGAGQSNWAGRGPNSSIASDLVSSTDAKMYYAYSSSTAPYWDNIRKEISSQIGLTTEHGMNMRWGKEAGSDFYLMGYGVSGTDLKTNWQYPGGTYYTTFKATYTQAFVQLLHVLRKTPVIRGFSWLQGEADAQSDGSTYQADLDELIRGLADDLIALSYDTAKMRVTIYRIRDQYPGFNATALAAVRAAQAYVGDNFLTDNPSYSTKVKSTRWVDTDSIGLQADQIHYTAAGLDTLGDEAFDYYDQYKTE